MNNYIVGVALLAVGFFGGYLATGPFDSSERAPENAEGSMVHATLVDVPGGAVAPTIDLEVLKDPKSGWNARITTTDFQFAPEKASTEHVFGEGHAHIYIDGVKINRVYGEWYHLGVLSEGEHEVRAELSANDHSTYAVSGVVIDDTEMITVLHETEPHGHDDSMSDEGHDTEDMTGERE